MVCGFGQRDGQDPSGVLNFHFGFGINCDLSMMSELRGSECEMDRDKCFGEGR